VKSGVASVPSAPGRAGTDRGAGVQIVGESAGEMIQLIAIVVKMGATKADLDATMAVHPNAAEELVTMRQPVVRHGVEVE